MTVELEQLLRDTQPLQWVREKKAPTGTERLDREILTLCV